MFPTPIARQIGRAKVTLFNIGELPANLNDWMRLEPAEWPAEFSDAFEKPVDVTTQCLHIRTPELSLIVDAGRE